MSASNSTAHNGVWKWIATLVGGPIFTAGVAFAWINFENDADHQQRISKLEAHYEDITRHLERIEAKIERQIDREVGRP